MRGSYCILKSSKWKWLITADVKKNEQGIPMQQAETDIMTERRGKFVFVTNFKYVKLILLFVLKQGEPCKCYIYNRWQLCPPVQLPGTLHNICGLVKAWSLPIDYSISGAKAAAMMVFFCGVQSPSKPLIFILTQHWHDRRDTRNWWPNIDVIVV